MMMVVMMIMILLSFKKKLVFPVVQSTCVWTGTPCSFNFINTVFLKKITKKKKLLAGDYRSELFINPR